MLLGRLTCPERTQVAALAGLRVRFTRVQAIFPGLQLFDHGDLLSALPPLSETLVSWNSTSNANIVMTWRIPRCRKSGAGPVANFTIAASPFSSRLVADVCCRQPRITRQSRSERKGTSKSGLRWG